jgi:hypothetical protein
MRAVILIVAISGIAIGAFTATIALRDKNEGLHSVQAPSEPRLSPVDEGRGHASFEPFRERLRTAATKRDGAFVESVLCPEVVVHFGPEGTGVAAFRETWRPQEPAFWETLQKVLRQGAARTDSRFVIPYIAAHWPEALDPVAHVAVIGTAIPLRSAPAGGVIGTVSDTIVKVEADDVPGWTQIVSPAGMAGFVPDDTVYTPLEMRIESEEVDGRWCIRALVAGD